MRYLYGDSTPFPLGYNFLTTLEAFMSAATRIVQLDVEGGIILKQRDELAQNRVKGLEALEQFHTVVMRAVQDTAQKVHHQHALDYARTIAEYATQYIEEHRRATLGANDRESMQLRGDGDRRSQEMRAHLEAFLKTSSLPILKTSLAIRLNIEGKDARHSGTASFEHPDGITSQFTIAPHRAATWQVPRKVGEFATGIDLHVGVEKSWLSGKVTAKQVNVDDWIVTDLVMTDDTFELSIRKNFKEKDTLAFHVRRHESGVTTGTVEQPNTPGADQLGSNLTGQDVQQIERVWAAMKAAVRDAVEQKEQLLGVTLDGQSVFENGLAVPFVVRLVTMFAPTIREITKRSPNEFELTLKVENETGRREELYLRKDGLINALQPLPAKGREVFAPLGLDKWVPPMTTAPPPVVTQTLGQQMGQSTIPIAPSVVPPAVVSPSGSVNTIETMDSIPPSMRPPMEGPPSMRPAVAPVAQPSSNPFIPAPPSSRKVP